MSNRPSDINRVSLVVGILAGVLLVCGWQITRHWIPRGHSPSALIPKSRVECELEMYGRNSDGRTVGVILPCDNWGNPGDTLALLTGGAEHQDMP
jgi:hypothetical protein